MTALLEYLVHCHKKNYLNIQSSYYVQLFSSYHTFPCYQDNGMSFCGQQIFTHV